MTPRLQEQRGKDPRSLSPNREYPQLLLVRASSSGPDAPMTTSDPPGKSEAAAPNGGTAAFFISQGVAPPLKAAAVYESGLLGEGTVSARSAALLLRRLRSVGGTHRRHCPNHVE
jgi:hypothetical protein